MKIHSLICYLALALSPPAFGDAPKINELVGLWKIIEWHHNGVVLTSPQIGGRMFLNNGKFFFIAFRENDEEREYLDGYGTYSIEGDEYRSGYDRTTSVSITGDGQEIFSGPWPETRFIAQSNGNRLEILDAETRTSGFVLEGDRLTYIEESKQLRVYERVSH